MITARLARAKPGGEPAFTRAELPKSLIIESEDPDAMGLGLEALQFHKPGEDDPRVKAAIEKTIEEARKRFGGKEP